jgi:hypothetical protein
MKGDAVRLLLLVLVAALMLAGCEGEEGPAGPAGNANVKTGTISPTNEEWICCSVYWLKTDPNTSKGYSTRSVDITVAEITPELISTGLVLVFFEANPGSANWSPLPIRFTNFDAVYAYNITYEVSEGRIRLHYFYTPEGASGTLPGLNEAEIPTYTFKYIVIEGTALQAVLASGVDVSNHDRITEFLTLQEY